MSELRVEVLAGEDVEPPVSLGAVEEVVRRVLRAEDVEEADISVALVSDAQVARLNHDYLDHQGPTDVLSFHLHQAGEHPVGDIYVGVEQALRQAAEHGATPAEEVLRLAVHGVLHVLGYDHPEGAARTTSPMFQRQEELLAAALATRGEGG